jgi:hypothetical protein
MRSVSFKALANAFVAGFVASLIYGFASVFILSKSFGINDALDLRAAIDSSPWVIAALCACSAAIYVGIGYLAAAIAKRAEMLHGALSTVPFILTGIYGVASGLAPEAATRNLILMAAAPLLGLLGGWLRQHRAQATARA